MNYPLRMQLRGSVCCTQLSLQLAGNGCVASFTVYHMFKT